MKIGEELCKLNIWLKQEFQLMVNNKMDISKDQTVDLVQGVKELS